jgi:hypothetical protein
MADGSITVLVGTTKGAFLINGNGSRDSWSVTGPFCDGWPINHVVGDPATGTLWAGGGGDWHGAGVWRSDDGGESWEVVRLTRGTMDEWAANDPDFAAMTGWTDAPLPFGEDFSQVWSLHHTHGTLYAGTKPARFLASRDGGETWEHLDGLANHPSADSWNPGAAGLILHTIVSDPVDPQKCGSASRRPASSPPRTAARHGSGATASPMPRPAGITTILPRRATAKPAIASTT